MFKKSVSIIVFLNIAALAFSALLAGGASANAQISTPSVAPDISGNSVNTNAQGTVISNVQTASGNWQSWGQGPPNYIDCSPSPCNGYQWSQTFGITSPSLSGNATEFSLGGNYGNAPYGDALFSAQLMGQNSPQIPDGDHTLLPTLHNFIYDTYFYVTNASITQVLEFDISMYMNGVGMIWGQQCNHLGDGDWDIWDNVRGKWVSTGIPCRFVNGWNHVTIQMQRESGNTLLYKSIALNGKTYRLNMTYPPGTAPSGWWGVTANYQMDGNSTQAPNITYLDKFKVTYW